MVRLTPTERLERLADVSAFQSSARGLLSSYERFLQETDAPENELIDRFMDKAEARRLFEQAGEFGDQVAGLLDLVGGTTSLRRLLLV